MRKAVIFDVDGTLSDCDHRRHHVTSTPKNWDAFFAEMHLDPPHYDVVHVAFMMFAAGYDIVIATGRYNKHRQTTIDWLRKHGIPFSKLYMRQDGDGSDDSLVKMKMLVQMREDGFNPVMAFEDRDRVVKAWRAAGLRCFQVAEGDF